MVWPDMLVTTSPGLLALPLGRFSQAGIRPTTSSGSSSSARARNEPSTLAAPPMSYFISSMVAAGLSEMPPASNVMPFADQHDRAVTALRPVCRRGAAR